MLEDPEVREEEATVPNRPADHGVLDSELDANLLPEPVKQSPGVPLNGLHRLLDGALRLVRVPRCSKKYRRMVYVGDEAYEMEEFPGPENFREWLSSFRMLSIIGFSLTSIEQAAVMPVRMCCT